MPLMDRACN